MKYSEIPLVVLMLFMLVYLSVGDPNSNIWSGLFFLVNYLTQLILFSNHKNKVIRIGGISLNISILLFVFLKYFMFIVLPTYYSLIPFTICLITLLCYEYVISKREIL